MRSWQIPSFTWWPAKEAVGPDEEDDEARSAVSMALSGWLSQNRSCFWVSGFLGGWGGWVSHVGSELSSHGVGVFSCFSKSQNSEPHFLKWFSSVFHAVALTPFSGFRLLDAHLFGYPDMAMGQNPVPTVNIPIPTID